MKATAQEYDLHQRIMARDDPVAFAQLFESLYSSLVQEIQQRAGWNTDPTLTEEAALQALSEYHEAPARYDPDRASLHHYLAMVAYRDFQNARKKELRVQAHQVSLFDPALRNIPGNVAFTEPAAIVASQDQIAELLHLVEKLFHNPIERRVATLIVNGVHTPEAYIQILDNKNASREEQIECITTLKYRILKRLRRNVGKQLHNLEGCTS
jgi:hypothetical protein